MDQEKDTSAGKHASQEKILLAALKLFAEKGYFNTSLTDITRAADLKSAHGIYHYFANKHAIAVMLYGSVLDNLSVSIDDIRRRQPSAADQLRDIVDLFFKLTDEAPEIMRFLLQMRLEEILPEQKKLAETDPFIKVYKIIQYGIRSGEIRSIDPQLANCYFFGVINNTLRMVLDGVLEKKADAYLPQTWLMAWNLIAKKSSSF